jgi:hypothetical protein
MREIKVRAWDGEKYYIPYFATMKCLETSER